MPLTKPPVALLLALGLLLTIALGGWEFSQIDQRMRQELRQDAEGLSQSIPRDLLSALHGARSDLRSPAYLSLKEQLGALKQKRHGEAIVSLYGQAEDGHIFLYANSEPLNAKSSSLPGQVLGEPSAGLRTAFASPAAQVDGPLPHGNDRVLRGLAPVRAQERGKPLAILAIDVSLGDWRRALLGNAAPPLTIVCIGVIVLISMMRAFQSLEPSPRPVLHRLLLALAALHVLLAALAGGVLWQLEKQHLEETVRARILKVPSDLRTALVKETAGLTMTLQAIAADPSTQEALAAGDRDGLLAAWQGVFTRLQREHDLTHFSFLGQDRACLLRLHDPPRFGDRVERFTARETEMSGITATGIELGPQGYFTLRAVQPVLVRGKTIGYVELGKEIEKLFTALPTRGGIELAVLLHKHLLSRPLWEAGMERLGRSAAWERRPDQVVAFSSGLGALPEALLDLSPHSQGGTQRHGEIHQLNIDDRPWRVGVFPLEDAAGAEVGDLLVSLDISALESARAQRLTLLLAGEAVLVALILGMVFVLLYRTDRSISLQRGVLEESEERLRGITEAARDAIVLMDPKGRISYWNPAAEAILGFRRQEAIGQDAHLLLAPERYHAAFRKAFPVFQESGQGAVVGQTVELAARHRDGREITIELSLSAIRLRGEWHAMTILRDITLRREAEAQQRLTNQELASASAQAQALAARAEAANVAKSEFLANMSHEIRTPMNGVIGMTELLLGTELTPTQRRYAEIVRTSGDALLDLINNILDISKIEAGKLELCLQDFDLVGLLDDITTSMALLAHNKGLDLLCRMEADVPARLQGDPGRLRQIIVNLTSNAIKFTSQGAVTIRVSRLAGAEGLTLLRFEVEDTGIGIPPEKQGLIFDKFTQVDASATRHYGGTGLGLAIARQLAEAMGGEMGVSSEEGQGSTFWFTARLLRQTDGQAHPQPTLAGHEHQMVLVVSGHPAHRDILRLRLSAWGLFPSLAESGQQGLELLTQAAHQGQPFPLALVDTTLPDMEAGALGQAIRADARLAATQLVLLANFGMRGDASHYQELGFNAYLTKPVLHQELFHLVAALLDKNHSPGPPAAHPQAILTRHSLRDEQRLATAAALRILVADDNLVNQQVTQSFLDHLGLASDVAGNGQEALAALASRPYDLVLMDVMMPVLDGMEATRQVRDPNSAVLNHDLPIIAMTASAMPSDRRQALAAGMNDYLTKPVDMARLLEVLRRWLPQMNAVAEAERTAGQATAVPGETPPIFDRASMMLLLQNNEDLARKLVAIFPKAVALDLAALKSHLAAGDCEASTRIAHSIKGSSAQMGGEALRRVAALMEADGKAGNLGAILHLLPELEENIAALVKALAEEEL